MQADQIANGIVMVCPKPGEILNPGYMQRATADCEKQVATALGVLSTPTITKSACGIQASRMALAYHGTDPCKK
jgi:hypothetical protein